jgi:hypothetical protein
MLLLAIFLGLVFANSFRVPGSGSMHCLGLCTSQWLRESKQARFSVELLL